MVPLSPEKRALFLIACFLYGLVMLRFNPLGRQAVMVDSKSEYPMGHFSVFIIGEVQRPGLYQFDPSSTVQYAVQSAGGPTPNADLGRLNLSEKLMEESVLRVPSITYGFKPMLSLNRSTIREFIAVPGIGPKLAERIVRDREEKGLFKDKKELLRVPGIGRKKLRQILECAVLN